MHYTLYLSVIEALIGFEKSVFLPSNHSVTLSKTFRTVDRISLTVLCDWIESVMIVHNEGIPVGSTGVRGGLIVHFSILFPYYLTKEEKESIIVNFGEESEEIIEYIHYHADIRLKQDSIALGYPLSYEEFLYSSQSTVNRCCFDNFLLL